MSEIVAYGTAVIVVPDATPARSPNRRRCESWHLTAPLASATGRSYCAMDEPDEEWADTRRRPAVRRYCAHNALRRAGLT